MSLPTHKNKYVQIEIYGLIHGPKNHLIFANKKQNRFFTLNLSDLDLTSIQASLEENGVYINPCLDALDELGWHLESAKIYQDDKLDLKMDLNLSNDVNKKRIAAKPNEAMAWVLAVEAKLYVAADLLHDQASPVSPTKIEIKDLHDDFKTSQKFLF